jgi:hypothetical protein
MFGAGVEGLGLCPRMLLQASGEEPDGAIRDSFKQGGRGRPPDSRPVDLAQGKLADATLIARAPCTTFPASDLRDKARSL